MPSRDLKVVLLGEDRTGHAFKSAADGADGLSGAMGKFGTIAKTGLLAAGVGVGLFAKASITAGADFDATLRQMAAVAGVPQAQLKTLSDLALKMGADTKFSAQQAADAMLELAKGGLTAAQIKGGALKQTLTLAAAGGLELAAAGATMSNAMNTFGLSAGKAGQVAAALAGGANASSASVESLGQALAQVGPGAKNAGLSIQETVAALAAFANKGIQGSDAGTSLKTMLTRLVPQTDAAAGAMRNLGIDFTNADGSFKSLAEISQILKTRMGGLSQEQRTTAMATIFGSDATRAATVLMGEGADGIKKYTKATSDQAAAQKVADATMQGVKGALEGLSGSWDTLKTRAGLALAPMIEGVAKFGTKVLNAVPQAAAALGTAFATVKADLAPFITDAVAKIKAGAPAIIESLKTGLVDAAAGIRDAAQPIIDALRSGISTGDYGPLGKALGEALADAIAAAGSAAKSIGTAIGSLLGKVDWAGLAVTMGKQAPAVLLGFAIGLLNFDFGAAISVLKDHWFDALIAVVTLAFAPARVIGKLGEILAKIPFVGSLLKWGLDALVKFSSGLVAKVGEVLSFMGRSFMEGFARVFPGVGTGFLNSLMILPQNLVIIAGRVGGEAVALMQRLLGGISGGIGAVIAKIGELIAQMLAPFVEVVARFGRIGADLIGGLARGVTGAAGEAGNAVRGVFAGIDRAGAALGGILVDAGRALMHGLAEGIRNAAGAAIQAAKDAAAAVAKAAKGVLGIHSPSRVFAEIGKNVGLGMALGIDGQRRNVTQSVRDLADLAGMQVGGPGFIQSRVGATTADSAAAGSSGTTYNQTVNMYGPLDDRMDEQSILTALRRVELLAG